MKETKEMKKAAGKKAPGKTGGDAPKPSAKRGLAVEKETKETKGKRNTGSAKGPDVSLLMIPISRIEQDEESRTRAFSEKPKELEGLVESIQAEGVVEPLIVRPPEDEKGKFLLTAGFRRLVAAKKAGLKEVPCLVRVMDDGQSLRVAFAENIPRRALSAMELALAMERVRGEFGWESEKGTKKVAEFFHVSTATVTQYEKLLALKPEQRRLVHEGVMGSQAAQEVADILKQYGEEKAKEVLGRAAEIEAEKREEKEKEKRAGKSGKSRKAGKKADGKKGKAGKPDREPSEEELETRTARDDEEATPRPISRTSVRKAAREKGAAPKKYRTIGEWVEVLEVLAESEMPKLAEFAKLAIRWQKSEVDDEGLLAEATRAFA